MKSIIFFIGLLLSVVSTPLSAQKEQDSLYAPRGTRIYGYVVTLDGDTLTGYVLNLNLWNNQMMTFLYQSMKTEDKGTKYRAKDLLGYKTGPRVYERLKYSGLFSPYKYNFFLKKLDGEIDLFVWYYNTEVNKLMGSDALLTEASDSFLIQEDNLWPQLVGRTAKGEIIEFGSLKFRPKFNRKMSHLVNDYPELSEKILHEEEGYRFENLEDIIKTYNAFKEKETN